MSSKALGKHIQSVMPTDGSRVHTHTIRERLYQQCGVTVTQREVQKELALMLDAGLVIYDHKNTPRWGTSPLTVARAKLRAPLAEGHPRRMTDGRCAWRKMTGRQRGEFLTWIQETEEESPVEWHTNSIVIAVTDVTERPA